MRLIVVVVDVDVEVRIDGEAIPFVARANMEKGYHACRDFQAEITGQLRGLFYGKMALEWPCRQLGFKQQAGASEAGFGLLQFADFQGKHGETASLDFCPRFRE